MAELFPVGSHVVTTDPLYLRRDQAERGGRVVSYAEHEQLGDCVFVSWDGTKRAVLVPVSALRPGTGRRREDLVFRDPAEKQVDAWRVRFGGDVLAPSFQSRGAAEVYLAALRAGTRRAER